MVEQAEWTMPCSMSDFMSPDRASRSGARARGGLNDRRVTTSKPGWKWRRGVSCLINIANTAVRSGSRSCTSEVLVNVALMRWLVELTNPRQTLPPYMHSGMKSGLPAFYELICATKT